MPLRVLVLGAGFGGLELSTRLAEELGDEVQVTLIDKSDAFVFGFSKLDVMFGRRQLDEVRLRLSGHRQANVEFLPGDRGLHRPRPQIGCHRPGRP